MKNKSKIYIIFGASGSGKTTLLHEISNTDIKHSIHTKGTTRKSRQYDGKEIKPVTAEEIRDYKYIYDRYGYKYGIDNIQIEDSIREDVNHFIVCNDIKVIRSIKNDFENNVRVLYLFYNAPKDSIEEIQRTRNISDDEIKLRIQKIDSLFDDYRTNSELFDHIINNVFGSPPSRMIKQLRAIVGNDSDMDSFHYTSIQNQLLNLSNKISDLETALLSTNESLEASIEKDFVFIVMAINPEIPELEDYKNAYKRVCSSLELRANRLDDFDISDQMTTKMLDSIRASEIVIVDLSLNKPNVFFEFGYAKAFGKDIILAAKEGTPRQFDTQNYQTIYYKSATDLETKLTSKLNRIINKRESIINN